MECNVMVPHLYTSHVPMLPHPHIIVHCGSSKQTVSIVSMNKEHLRTGDKATCLFRFIKNPEYLRPGARMVFREGRTKAVGNVTKVFLHIPGCFVQGAKPKFYLFDIDNNTMQVGIEYVFVTYLATCSFCCSFSVLQIFFQFSQPLYPCAY